MHAFSPVFPGFALREGVPLSPIPPVMSPGLKVARPRVLPFLQEQEDSAGAADLSGLIQFCSQTVMLPTLQTPCFGLFLFFECKMEVGGSRGSEFSCPPSSLHCGASQICDLLASCGSPASTGVAQEKDPEHVTSSPPAPTPHPQLPLSFDPLIFPKKLSQAFPQTQTAIREILLPDGLVFSIRTEARVK